MVHTAAMTAAPAAAPLQRLFYISRAHVDPCGTEPRRILEVATQRNASLDVTGALCCSGEHFAQVLEGPGDALDELMRSIRADGRHTVLVEWPRAGAADARWYPGWAMGWVLDERLEALLAQLLASTPRPPFEPAARRLLQDVALFKA
jgi:hypothetical protein